MTNEKMTAVKTALENLETSDIIVIWNAYCEDHRMDDDMVEYMDNFNDLFCDSDPLWLALRIFYGNFNPNHDYFVLDGYGNFESFDYWDDRNSPITIDEDLVEWFCESFDDRDNYLSEDNIAEDFVDYINRELKSDYSYSIQEIYDLANKGEEYDLNDILEDDWSIWFANVKDGMENHPDGED